MAARKKQAKRKSSGKTAPKKPAARKGAAKQPASRKKSMSRKTSARKAAPSKVAAKKKPTPRKAAAKKVAPRKVTAKDSARQAPAKKAPARTAPVASVKTARPVRPAPVAARKPVAIKTGGKARNINKDYMNTEQSAKFRKQLLEWKRSLMEEVDRTVHHMQDEASNFPDPNDRATQEEEFALELRTRDRERKLIKKIDDALLNLDLGEYGYCEICGVEIGIKRLEARPTATLCIDCKNLEEIKERQYG